MDNEAAAPQPTDVAADSPAGFWIRAGAYMIDGILVALVSVVANFILPGPVSVVARLLISAGYFTIMPVHFDGQTLGKMAAGVKIVRSDGSPLTYGRAFARWLGYLLSGITLCLGFVCAAATKNKRALHDYIADTRVVRVEELALGRKIAVVFAGLLFPLLIAFGVVAAVAASRDAAPKNTADEAAAPTAGTAAPLPSLPAKAAAPAAH